MLTNREFHLQTGNLAYKTGFSFTKRESWVTKGILGLLFTTIKKYENGERALSITNLFKIIDYFKVDANTILNVAESKKETSIDSRLELMDCSKKAYFQKIFNEMLDNAEMLVS